MHLIKNNFSLVFFEKNYNKKNSKQNLDFEVKKRPWVQKTNNPSTRNEFVLQYICRR